MSWYSIIHAAPAELPAYFAEFARVLAEGGFLLAAFFESAGGPVTAFDHKVAPAFLWPVDDLAALAGQAGFAEVGRMLREPREQERFQNRAGQSAGKGKYTDREPYVYTDAEIAENENAVLAEKPRGATPLRRRDVLAGMLRIGPALVTDVVVERDVPVSAPDGVSLLTDVYLAASRQPLPVILVRSPYGRGGPSGVTGRIFAERGYHAVVQSTRGTSGSGGKVDFDKEATDGRATADWIVEQDWCNGSIGTFGGSYLSFTQYALASTRPPQLKAMATGVWAAERRAPYYYGGPFALGRALSWPAAVAKQEEGGLGASLRGVLRARRALVPALSHLPLLDADTVAYGHPVSFYRDWISHDQPGDPYWAPTLTAATRAPQLARVELWPTAHRFAAGHRIRLQVSSGAHPRFARNLGSGEPLATGTTLRVAEQAVYHGPEHQSAVLLPTQGLRGNLPHGPRDKCRFPPVSQHYQ